MAMILGSVLDLLYNNSILCVLIEAILMSKRNIQFHDKIRKNIPKYLFFELSEEFGRDWKTSSN